MGLEVASMFTGSDFARTAIEALVKYATSGFPQGEPTIHHVMVVEHNPAKQRWLKHVFPPKVVIK